MSRDTELKNIHSYMSKIEVFNMQLFWNDMLWALVLTSDNTSPELVKVIQFDKDHIEVSNNRIIKNSDVLLYGHHNDLMNKLKEDSIDIFIKKYYEQEFNYLTGQ